MHIKNFYQMHSTLRTQLNKQAGYAAYLCNIDVSLHKSEGTTQIYLNILITINKKFAKTVFLSKLLKKILLQKYRAGKKFYNTTIIKFFWCYQLLLILHMQVKNGQYVYQKQCKHYILPLTTTPQQSIKIFLLSLRKYHVFLYMNVLNLFYDQDIFSVVYKNIFKNKYQLRPSDNTQQFFLITLFLPKLVLN
eukprot:TRINITY_DN2816_c1_g2_i1.p1 TRINITY_DN2816_c1_g2~~TRINITY_DN2816_c1_g2_i1.p1  ORF type:complete len:192 (+),score=-9.95 TRINITY_DN2816_c1_g2_i1:762-1337(+)